MMAMFESGASVIMNECWAGRFDSQGPPVAYALILAFAAHTCNISLIIRAWL